jgi:hypothetical protein
MSLDQLAIDRTLNHLGALGLLAEVSIYIRNGVDGDEFRDCIERCLRDAEQLGMIRWRRIINRFEVEPAASSVLTTRAVRRALEG